MFLAAVFGAVVWLAWLASSKHGNIVLGPDGEKPRYGTISWFGMLFCAGIGSNLLYFGTTEWVGYFETASPFPSRSRVSGSCRLGRCLRFLPLGISAWALYALASVPIGYFLFVHGLMNSG